MTCYGAHVMAGHAAPPPQRSIASGAEGYTACRCYASSQQEGGPLHEDNIILEEVWAGLRAAFPRPLVGGVKGMAACADGLSAVFDVPSALAGDLDGRIRHGRLCFEICGEVPEMAALAAAKPRRRRRRRGGAAVVAGSDEAAPAFDPRWRHHGGVKPPHVPTSPS